MVEEQKSRFREEAKGAKSASEVRALRILWLGRNQGIVTALLATLRDVPRNEKAVFGASVNDLKTEVEETLKRLEAEAEERARASTTAAQAVDVTLPPRTPPVGRLHPLTVVRRQIEDAFRALGYEVADGPEIETDWLNFGALNFPADHPARDEVDTFFVKDGGEGRDRLLLRTHTSPVQIRTMLSQKPPIRIVIPGRVYRKDAIDPRHSPVFHQVEGLTVDEGITFSDLKGTLAAAFRQLFSPKAKIRFGPTFFPFVEPGVEVAVSCVFCDQKGCRVCGNSGWIEIMGAGMVHPKVLASGGIDPERYTGFAFGGGYDRIAMLVHGIPDLRLLFENDVRFLDRTW
ncbi:MAG: phenylalanine--tRNA ligase subunit alpha [Thermoanaerobaculia bacterium]